MFDDELLVLGLSDNQRTIYSAVISAGKVTPVRLSAETGMNRTTVYAVCKELLSKGFVQEDTLKGVTYYYPTPPKELVKVARKERQALINKELALQEIAKGLESLPQSKTYAIPKIRFVEHEAKVEEFLYERVHVWRESEKGGNPDWYGFQDHSLIEHAVFGKWIQWYWKSYPETKLYLLSNDSEIETKMTADQYANRSIKFWKKGFDFTETQWIVGDYSIMIMSKQKPHYLIELHDAVYADNMRKLFKNLWEEIK